MSAPCQPITASASCVAPKPGVLVTAPKCTPSIVGRSIRPAVSAQSKIVTKMESTMAPAASPLRMMPPDLKLEKNEGPTCRPMKKMKSIRPKSRRKVKTCGSIAMPKCPAASPTKSTNVTPRETPPECKPDGDDERVHQDDVRDRRGGGENGFHGGGCGSSASRGQALDALDL